MPTETLERRTIGEELAALLRKRILRGELRPGQALPEAAIAERYDTSRPSVRDALRRLAHDGLVQHETHRGARVATLDPADRRDISEARLVIEPQVVRRAAFGDGTLAQLLEIAGRLEAAADAGDWQAYSAADVAFHATLVGATSSRRLAELHARAMRELRLHFTSVDRDDERPGLERRHVAEHRQIVEYLEDGDRPSAARLLTRHLEDARDTLS